MKRHELLTQAQQGLIKKGDKFKSDSGFTAVFDGKVFRYEDDGVILKLQTSNVEWTPVPKGITVELTQAQINTIFALANRGNAREQIMLGNSRRLEVVSDWDLYHIFKDLAEAGGTN